MILIILHNIVLDFLFHTYLLDAFWFKLYVQMVKCGDYFQAEDGPREFGDICIVTKWIRTTDTSLELHLLEVNHREVRWIFENTADNMQADGLGIL